VAGAHVIDACLDLRGGVGGVGPVAILHEQVGERRQVAGDVPPWRLHVATHGDPEVVVLDVEEHRELERRRHRQGRPEAVGGDGAVTA
jgi:hypothetical protein